MVARRLGRRKFIGIALGGTAVVALGSQVLSPASASPPAPDRPVTWSARVIVHDANGNETVVKQIDVVPASDVNPDSIPLPAPGSTG
jgi:hypothetical protein